MGSHGGGRAIAGGWVSRRPGTRRTSSTTVRCLSTRWPRGRIRRMAADWSRRVRDDAVPAVWSVVARGAVTSGRGALRPVGFDEPRLGSAEAARQTCRGRSYRVMYAIMVMHRSVASSIGLRICGRFAQRELRDAASAHIASAPWRLRASDDLPSGSGRGRAGSARSPRPSIPRGAHRAASATRPSASARDGRQRDDGVPHGARDRVAPARCAAGNTATSRRRRRRRASRRARRPYPARAALRRPTMRARAPRAPAVRRGARAVRLPAQRRPAAET